MLVLIVLEIFEHFENDHLVQPAVYNSDSVWKVVSSLVEGPSEIEVSMIDPCQNFHRATYRVIHSRVLIEVFDNRDHSEDNHLAKNETKKFSSNNQHYLSFLTSRFGRPGFLGIGAFWLPKLFECWRCFFLFLEFQRSFAGFAWIWSDNWLFNWAGVGLILSIDWLWLNEFRWLFLSRVP